LKASDISGKVKVTKHNTPGDVMFSIHSFDDFCLWMYVMIDDWYQQGSAQFRRAGPDPETGSDSEVLTMVLVGECCGWHEETELLRQWAGRKDLFPHQPSLSRFNRRRRALAPGLAAFHQFVLGQLAWADDRLLLLDSVPLAVVSRARGRRGSSDWRVHDADYGYAHTKRLPFFGYCLHVLATCGGVILDWVLTNPKTSDVTAAEDLLSETLVPLHGRWVLADKGYTSAALRQIVWARRKVGLVVLPKRGMRAAQHLPLAVRHRFSRLRQRIETLNSQLAQQFGVEHTHAHSFDGMVARLRAKLTAHVCCVYANWLSGAALDQALHIKHWVTAL
jgi:hypothetical protein